MDDRRKFERVNIPESAKVFAEDRLGKALGLVRVLGRGGLFVETEARFREGSTHTIVIVDEEEGIRRPVQAVSRYSTPEGAGFEFDKLEPDAAVEIGVIIGKYYSSSRSEK